jgi:hypothetical protein
MNKEIRTNEPNERDAKAKASGKRLQRRPSKRYVEVSFTVPADITALEESLKQATQAIKVVVGNMMRIKSEEL